MVSLKLYYHIFSLRNLATQYFMYTLTLVEEFFRNEAVFTWNELQSILNWRCAFTDL